MNGSASAEALVGVGSRSRSRSTGDSHRSAGNVKVEIRRLLAEWDRLDCRRVVRNVAKWNGDVADLKSTLKLCERLRSCARKVLARDVEVHCKHNLTAKLWKEGIYPIVEKLRAHCTAGGRGNGAGDVLMQFLEEVMSYYSGCVQLVQNKLSFSLSALASGQMKFTSKTQHREVMMVVAMCHHWYIFLGDLSRYQQRILTSQSSEVNWAKPRCYYSKAQQLSPKDGRPYNQLAVVSISTHRRLDAVYYYMRSLATVPPFQSAYDSLVAIFAETGQKAKRKEEDERMVREREEARAARRKRRTERLARRKEKKSQRKSGSKEAEDVGGVSGRKEVWTMPGEDIPRGVESASGVDLVSEEGETGVKPDAKDSSTREELAQVAKRVTLLFLQIHGRLFSKIGIEGVVAMETRLMGSFAQLLSGPLRTEMALVFFKMAVINLYSIHHHMPDDGRSFSGSGTYLHCSRALRVALHMTRVMLVSCQDVLHHNTRDAEVQTTENPSSSSTGQEVNDRKGPTLKAGLSEVWPVSEVVLDILSVVLPGARLVFDWLLEQEELAVKCTVLLDQGLVTKFWSAAADFLNKAGDLKIGIISVERIETGNGAGIEQSRDQRKRARSVCLWEDRALAGFMPLKSSLSTLDSFSLPQFKRLSSKDHWDQVEDRVALLRQMWYQLCSKPLLTRASLSHDPTTGRVKVQLSLGETKEERTVGSEEVWHDEDDVVELESDSSLSVDLSEEVEYLSEEEEDLEAGQGTMDQTRQDQGSREIQHLKALRDDLTRHLEERELAEAATQNVLQEAGSKLEEVVYVAPYYLVPDTNCFVDQLTDLQELVDMKTFQLVLPLVVYSELEGLSRGAVGGADASLGGARLDRVSTEAKKALEFISGCFHGRSPHLKLLTTQGSLLHSSAFRAEVTDKVSNDDLILNSCLQLHLRTKSSHKHSDATSYRVVLLTDDRNLRVKAHAAGQPVRDIPGFMALLKK